MSEIDIENWIANGDADEWAVENGYIQVDDVLEKIGRHFDNIKDLREQSIEEQRWVDILDYDTQLRTILIIMGLFDEV